MDHSNNALPIAAGCARIQPIDPYALLHQLTPVARAYALEIVECTGSTNTDLLERWRTHPASHQAVIRLAYEQTAGRGRQGRRWLAKPGDALLFSISCRLPKPIGHLAGLSLAIGTALLSGLRTFAPARSKRLALKWPNDVLLDQKKLAGILIETAQHTPHSTDAVIGIGLNLNLPSIPEPTPTEQGFIPLSHAALSQILPIAGMTDVFAALLNALIPALEHFGQKGFAPFLPAWLKDHAYTGHHAYLIEQGQEKYKGCVLGADEQGRLLLETDTGVQTIVSGDLSLRTLSKAGETSGEN